MRKLLLFSMTIGLSVPLWTFGFNGGAEAPGSSGAMSAVQQTVSGTVTGADGEPLAGASVSVVGSEVATSTNEAGEFSLPSVSPDDLLSFFVVIRITPLAARVP